MSEHHDNPYAALKCVFHEPSRLAILSALCTAVEGLTFNELKHECDLTDGNLSRHLKMLEDAGTIAIHKEFVGAKPRTTVYLSEQGRQDFMDYLVALEEVLKLAGKSVESREAVRADSLPNWKAAQA